jgi:acyl-CoA thioesterase-1
MRNASALSRFVAPMIAVGVLMAGCGQAPQSQDHGSPETGPSRSAAATSSSEQATPGKASAVPAAAAPGEPVAAAAAKAKLIAEPDPTAMVPGSVYRNPANGRDEVIVADIRNTALLIGDSQSEPAVSWPRLGLAAMGYKVFFCGKGGTGYVAANGKTGNYIDALQRGDWQLPYGSPPLVVIEGGGNDAARGATDAQIIANAERLISTLKQRYPGTKLAMIGTLARGVNYGGGRRSQVDSLLGTVAAKHAIPFVSVGDWLTKYGLAKDLADGVHMNSQGHKALGVLLGARLQELGLHAPAIAGVKTFRDVATTNRFYNEISWLSNNLIIQGYPDGTFRPLTSINRDAMAALLYRLAGSPAVPANAPTFTDVAPSNPFYNEIRWLASQGISTGYPDGTFRPLAPVNRDAMAAFLYRYNGKPAVPSTAPTFPDVTSSNLFFNEIRWLAATAITTGYPDGTFKPRQLIRRDAMAAFVYRYNLNFPKGM